MNRPRPGWPHRAGLTALAVAAFGLAVAPAEASMARCQSHSERGYHEAAISNCNRVIERASSASTRSEALFYRANSKFSLGDIDGALEDINAALAGGRESPKALALRGAIRLEVGDAEGAIEDFDNAEDAGYDDARMLRLRAGAWLELGEPGNAIDDLETVIGRDSHDFVALTQLAFARYSAGDFATAREAADEAIVQGRGYAAAFGVRAAIAAAEGDVQGALADYTRASEAAPDDPGYHLGRASILVAAGSADVALADVDSVLADDPANQTALALRADIHEETGNLEAALADLDGLSDGNGDLALRRARLSLQLGLLERAETEYSQALSENPGNAEILFERGQTRAFLDDDAGAAEDFSGALEADSRLADSGLLLMRGKARFALGDLEGAVADFEGEADRLPEAPSPRIWLARALSDLGDQDAAEAAARDLLELEPERPRAYAILGDVLLRKGDIAGGRAAHERAIELDGDYAPSQQRLAELEAAAN